MGKLRVKGSGTRSYRSPVWPVEQSISSFVRWQYSEFVEHTVITPRSRVESADEMLCPVDEQKSDPMHTHPAIVIADGNLQGRNEPLMMVFRSSRTNRVLASNVTLRPSP